MSKLHPLTKWVIEKIEADYKEDIALLIGIKGHSTDNDEHGECFDYFIPATGRGCELAQTFIIDGVGHDLYPRSWERMERSVELKEMAVLLTGATILYARSEEDVARFEDMQRRLQDNLNNDAFVYEKALDCLDYALEVCNAVLDVWQPTADNKAIINLPTTVQVAMPHVFACQVEYMHKHLKYRDNVVISVHPHNDRGCGVATAEMGLLAGADRMEATLFGNGERTGNVPLEAMVFEYASLRGSLDGMDTTVITEIADFFKKDVGYDIPPMTPFTGSAFNVTRAGVHADGLMKDEEIYTIFDTKKILNRPASVQISKTSGLAGIAYWINQTYNLEGDAKLDKRAPLVVAMKEWVDEQYEEGRQTAMTDKELEEKIAQLAPELHKA